MQPLSREEFLRGLWSYWLVVGIATRRARRAAASEKTTTLLKHLWKRRMQFTERRSEDAPCGFWPERQVLWVQRNELRTLLRLPEDQFPDDDAVNVFYRGQAFYDQTTNQAMRTAVRAWRLTGTTVEGAKIPRGLQEFAKATLQLDCESLAFPGWYFNGYDDATIWIGRTLDETIVQRLATNSPSERVLLIRGAPMPTPTPERTLLEPLLDTAIRAASTPADHATTRALIEQAVTNDVFPQRLVPHALAYLLFVQTTGIPGSVTMIRRLSSKRQSLLPSLFDEQMRRDPERSRAALVLLFGALHTQALPEECERLLCDLPPELFDPTTLLELLKQMQIPSRTDANLVNYVVQALRTAACTDQQNAEMEYLLTLRSLVNEQ